MYELNDNYLDDQSRPLINQDLPSADSLHLVLSSALLREEMPVILDSDLCRKMRLGGSKWIASWNSRLGREGKEGRE